MLTTKTYILNELITFFTLFVFIFVIEHTFYGEGSVPVHSRTYTEGGITRFRVVRVCTFPPLKGDQLAPLDTRSQSGSPAYVELTFTYTEVEEHVTKTLNFSFYLYTSLHKLFLFLKRTFRAILKKKLLLMLRNLLNTRFNFDATI